MLLRRKIDIYLFVLRLDTLPIYSEKKFREGTFVILLLHKFQFPPHPHLPILLRYSHNCFILPFLLLTQRLFSLVYFRIL